MYFEQYHELLETVNNPSELIDFNFEPPIFNENYTITNIANENLVDNTETRILQNNFNTALKFNFMFNSGTFASCNILDTNDFGLELRENYIQIIDVIRDIEISFNHTEEWDEIDEEFSIEEDYNNVEYYNTVLDDSNNDYVNRLTENYTVKQTQLNMELYKIQGGNKIVIKTL